MTTTHGSGGTSRICDGLRMKRRSRGHEGGEGDVIEVWSYQSNPSVLLMTLRWSSFGRHSTYSQDGACARYTGVVPCFGITALLLGTRTEVRRFPLVLYACILISSRPSRLDYNTTDHYATSQRVDE